MKQTNGQQIVELFEKWAPKSLAYEGDPIGLQIGTLNKPVSKVLVTLDVNPKVVEEAVKNGCRANHCTSSTYLSWIEKICEQISHKVA